MSPGLISSWTRRDAFQGYQKNVSEQEIDFLLAHDYELSRKDADSIRRAVSPLRFCAVPAGAARFRLMDCYLPRSLTYSTLTSPLTSKCMRVAVARVFKC
jgi:hypothetical protein